MKRIFIPSDILRILKDNDVIKPSFEGYLKYGINNTTLVNFLIKEKCLKDYIEERSKHIKENKLEYYYFFTSIMSSFNWGNTKQGFNFWPDLSRKYANET